MEEFRQKLVVDTLHTSTCTSSNVILMDPCFGVFKVKKHDLSHSSLETHKYAHSILGYSWKDTVPVFMCLELGSFFVQYLVLCSHYNIRVCVCLSS